MSDDIIIKKLEEHDTRFEQIDARLDKVDMRLDNIDIRLDKVDKRLDNIDVRLDKVDTRLDNIDIRLDKVDTRLDNIDVRLDKVDTRLDKLTAIVIEHGERLDQTVTKDEFNQFRREQSNANDQMITILKRLDEERYATIEWLRRVDGEVEDQKKKIHEHELALQRIRQELNLAF